MDAGNAEPVLESVFPTLGPTRGSTVVTITGSNFVDGSTVCRAGHASWSVASCSSSMECVCTIPAHSQGRFPLTVSADGGLTFSKDSVAFMFYCTHYFVALLIFRMCALPNLLTRQIKKASLTSLRPLAPNSVKQLFECLDRTLLILCLSSAALEPLPSLALGSLVQLWIARRLRSREAQKSLCRCQTMDSIFLIPWFCFCFHR